MPPFYIQYITEPDGGKCMKRGTVEEVREMENKKSAEQSTLGDCSIIWCHC